MDLNLLRIIGLGLEGSIKSSTLFFQFGGKGHSHGKFLQKKKTTSYNIAKCFKPTFNSRTIQYTIKHSYEM